MSFSSALPFSLLAKDEISVVLSQITTHNYSIGQKILRPGTLNSHVYIINRGNARVIGINPDDSSHITLDLLQPGTLIGWTNLLLGHACEFVIASTDVQVSALPADAFLSLISSDEKVSEFFDNTFTASESFPVYKNLYQRGIFSEFSLSSFKEFCASCALLTSPNNSPLDFTSQLQSKNIYLSTPGLNDYPVGTVVHHGDILHRKGFKLKLRYLFMNKSTLADSSVSSTKSLYLQPQSTSQSIPTIPTDLEHLGIIEPPDYSDVSIYPHVKANDTATALAAVIQMSCLLLGVPYKKDLVNKYISEFLRRDKVPSLYLLSTIFEYMTISTQIGSAPLGNLHYMQYPSICFINSNPVVIYNILGAKAIVGNPKIGITQIPLTDLPVDNNNNLKFLTLQKTVYTPSSNFSLSWFLPLLKKYKKSLAIVLLASLFAQLFGIAIPLLIQQIIDKVLAQGNLSSLNVLGSAMILLALFQGILQSLRTFVFVDTTDRMDLTLGSAVIDRLLSLPLPYFEKRPVGELSQRLSELNSIRSFLTGTAMISALNLFFASFYLAVMLFYSVPLTFVALSALPLYLIIIFFASPIYKSFIRRKAVASASTQSHLIEVVGGIQTVKAQNFELAARWKWQDRYKRYVSEGFKSTVVGSTTSELGNFLTQLSGLLVLWVGMTYVLDSRLTLGQLIAFRILSTSVIGPLLQISSLYQGFQGFQLSMERLGDIIDQPSEYSGPNIQDQLALPPVQGQIIYSSVSFKYPKSTNLQVNSVSFTVSPGSFVGIVGKSGSGKSTLTKLLSRLYPLDSGTISVDGYDISKVDLHSLRSQIGIVPQDSLLFDGTITSNVSLNDPEASTDAIVEACRVACCHEFIMNLPDGYATPVAEKGSNLSGGQRQRLAIARTLLSNPTILIMDEATSSLDYETEARLSQNLQLWAKGRTVLFITHRLSSIVFSDSILVMNSGELVEQGTHDDLLQRNGFYAALYRQQQSTTA